MDDEATEKPDTGESHSVGEDQLVSIETRVEPNGSDVSIMFRSHGRYHQLHLTKFHKQMSAGPITLLGMTKEQETKFKNDLQVSGRTLSALYDRCWDYLSIIQLSALSSIPSL